MTTSEVEIITVAAPGRHRGRRKLPRFATWISSRVRQIQSRLTTTAVTRREYRSALAWQEYAALAEGADSDLYADAQARTVAAGQKLGIWDRLGTEIDHELKH